MFSESEYEYMHDQQDGVVSWQEFSGPKGTKGPKGWNPNEIIPNAGYRVVMEQKERERQQREQEDSREKENNNNHSEL